MSIFRRDRIKPLTKVSLRGLSKDIKRCLEKAGWVESDGFMIRRGT